METQLPQCDVFPAPPVGAENHPLTRASGYKTAHHLENNPMGLCLPELLTPDLESRKGDVVSLARPWGPCLAAREPGKLKSCTFAYFLVLIFEGGGQREGDTGSRAGSRLQAVSTESQAGLELTNREIMA